MVVDEDKMLAFIYEKVGKDFSKEEIKTVLDAELKYLISEGIAEETE